MAELEGKEEGMKAVERQLVDKAEAFTELERRCEEAERRTEEQQTEMERLQSEVGELQGRAEESQPGLSFQAGQLGRIGTWTD